MANTNFKLSMAAIRVNAGFTQSEIAEKMHISKVTLCSWETGKTSPRQDQFKEFCDICGVPNEYIFLIQT